tara:strand:+ start:1221 stop:1586 length:366 start_codon:yes stop_codon:yes gene_type:complete
MFHSKASYSPMDKNNIKPHLNNINIREGVRTATIKDKKLRRKYFTSQIFNIIIILIIVIFQVKTIKTIQKLEEKNIDIERKLFALETFINDSTTPGNGYSVPSQLYQAGADFNKKIHHNIN